MATILTEGEMVANSPKVTMIWAQTPTGVIGKDNMIPWHVPEDQAFFREMTANHAVVMGRRTWESLPDDYRPLPRRRNLVLTRQTDWSDDGAERIGSVDEALAAVEHGDLWVIGGSEIYRAFEPLATRCVITEIDVDVEGDTFAPELHGNWRVVSSLPEDGWDISGKGPRYRFLTLRRPPRV